MVYDVTHLQKKANTNMAWKGIKCEASKEKSAAKVPKYNFNKLRRSGRIYYFGPQPKLGALGTLVTNPIEVEIDDGDGELTHVI